MSLPPRMAGHFAAVGTLLVLALWLPLPLYLVSLAMFGLPHVVWELGYLRSRYAGRWPVCWWYALAAVLLLQAAARGAHWWGAYPSEKVAIVDLVALLLLAVLVALAPAATGWRARACALALGAGILALLNRGEIVAALLLLAVAHNFTPVLLAWDFARGWNAGRPFAWTVTALFALPLLVAASGWSGGASSPVLASYAAALDGQLPALPPGVPRASLLSALVLAQCLHYYSVIVLLPQAEGRRTGIPVLGPRAATLLTLAALGLMAYFVADFAQARRLYAVASGAHAWLEWPVLLMAMLGGAASGAPARMQEAVK